jgi:hypothetical protein
MAMQDDLIAVVRRVHAHCETDLGHTEAMESSYLASSRNCQIHDFITVWHLSDNLMGM